MKKPQEELRKQLLCHYSLTNCMHVQQGMPMFTLMDAKMFCKAVAYACAERNCDKGKAPELCFKAAASVTEDEFLKHCMKAREECPMSQKNAKLRHANVPQGLVS